MSAPEAPATADAPEPTRGFMLNPAPHEVGAHLIYTEHDLVPYHALDSVVKSGGGSVRTTFDRGGDEFLASVSYSDCELAPPDDPSLDFRQETVKEFELHLTKPADDVGALSAHYNISPRWPDLKNTDGGDVKAPDILGVNIETQGSNLPIDAYPDLLRAAMDALDVNSDYFAEIHPYSSIFAFERYARIARSESGCVFGTNSPMQRVFRYVDGRAKYRELREDDRNGVEGYHHRVVLDSASVGSLIPGHGYGKRIKHYHPKHPRSDPSDPLYHPKLGVSLKTNANTSGSVSWADRADLTSELDETLMNLMSWAGLPTRPDGETFVEDAYFVPTDSPRSLRLVEDPTEGMKQEQYVAARRALLGDPDDPDDDGANATERDALKALADGGQRDVSALAEAISRSRSTTYRVLDALGDSVQNQNGSVAFGSDYLAEQFAALLSDASLKIQRDGETSDSSAWAAFLTEFGPSISDLPGDTIELRFGTVDPETDVKAVLRKGLTAWLRSGREKRRFVRGVAHWTQDGEDCQAGGPTQKMDLPMEGGSRVRALD
jgi:hypothetical protein